MNHLYDVIIPSERGILNKRLATVNSHLRQGIEELHWDSLSLSDILCRVYQLVFDVHMSVSKTKEMMDVVADIATEWSNVPLIAQRYDVSFSLFLFFSFSLFLSFCLLTFCLSLFLSSLFLSFSAFNFLYLSTSLHFSLGFCSISPTFLPLTLSLFIKSLLPYPHSGVRPIDIRTAYEQLPEKQVEIRSDFHRITQIVMEIKQLLLSPTSLSLSSPPSPSSSSTSLSLSHPTSDSNSSLSPDISKYWEMYLTDVNNLIGSSLSDLVEQSMAHLHSMLCNTVANSNSSSPQPSSGSGGGSGFTASPSSSLSTLIVVQLELSIAPSSSENEVGSEKAIEGRRERELMKGSESQNGEEGRESDAEFKSLSASLLGVPPPSSSLSLSIDTESEPFEIPFSPVLRDSFLHFDPPLEKHEGSVVELFHNISTSFSQIGSPFTRIGVERDERESERQRGDLYDRYDTKEAESEREMEMKDERKRERENQSESDGSYSSFISENPEIPIWRMQIMKEVMAIVEKCLRYEQEVFENVSFLFRYDPSRFLSVFLQYGMEAFSIVASGVQLVTIPEGDGEEEEEEERDDRNAAVNEERSEEGRERKDKKKEMKKKKRVVRARNRSIVLPPTPKQHHRMWSTQSSLSSSPSLPLSPSHRRDRSSAKKVLEIRRKHDVYLSPSPPGLQDYEEVLERLSAHTHSLVHLPDSVPFAWLLLRIKVCFSLSFCISLPLFSLSLYFPLLFLISPLLYSSQSFSSTHLYSSSLFFFSPSLFNSYSLFYSSSLHISLSPQPAVSKLIKEANTWSRIFKQSLSEKLSEHADYVEQTLNDIEEGIRCHTLSEEDESVLTRVMESMLNMRTQGPKIEGVFEVMYETMAVLDKHSVVLSLSEKSRYNHLPERFQTLKKLCDSVHSKLHRIQMKQIEAIQARSEAFYQHMEGKAVQSTFSLSLSLSLSPLLSSFSFLAFRSLSPLV